MKIQCEFCNSMFNDTLEQCPNCGAVNKNVRRSTSDQPTTIEGLKEWYESKGLPPYETTRFFIGENHTGPKAFGIYKDELSGNFIVYKNKVDGSRAVRYEGTDEAFAVNEIQTRLKQEILQQKAAASKPAGYRPPSGNKSGSSKPKKSGITRIFGRICIITMVITFLAGIISYSNRPAVEGYYEFDDELYYHYYEDEYGWAHYDESEDDWVDVFYCPYTELVTQRSAKNYFLSEDYKKKYGGYDYADSLACSDRQNGYCVSTGYYSYDGDVYYHMRVSSDMGWYTYDYDDDDWYEIDYDDMPDALLHQTYAEDFWYTPDWNEETQYSDFEDTAVYQDYQEELNSYSYDDDDSSSSWYDDDDDYDYDWDDDYDSWDYDSSDWDSDW